MRISAVGMVVVVLLLFATLARLSGCARRNDGFGLDGTDGAVGSKEDGGAADQSGALDLGSARGCLVDDECPAGTFCSAATHRCLSGCRNSDECELAKSCVDHACINQCDCDDHNACTDDPCVHGVCQKKTPIASGTPCQMDCRNPGMCDGAGTCLATSLPDGTKCGNTAYQYCQAGTCTKNWSYCDTWLEGAPGAKESVAIFWMPDGSRSDTAQSCVCTSLSQLEISYYSALKDQYGCAICRTALGVTVPSSGTRYICLSANKL
jgi:hypothetical protein